MRAVADTGLEFIVLALRIAMVFFLYFFLFQVMRIVGRELRNPGSAGGAAPAPGPLGQLTLISPGQTGLPVGRVYPLKAVTTVGRRPDADISLNDTFISSEHSLIEWRGNSWWVEDLGSTNGTWVNDIEVTAATQLSYGDHVRFGRVEFKLGS